VDSSCDPLVMNKFIPKRQGLGLILVLWMLGALAVVCFTRRNEPSYQGKTLTAWIDQYRTYSQADTVEAWKEFEPKVLEAEKAIGNISTNGIPFLLKKLTTPESRFNDFMNRFLNRQSFLPFRFRDAELERRRAVEGFRALGEVGRPACPELAKLLHDPNPQVRFSASVILFTYQQGPPHLSTTPLFDPIAVPPPKPSH
jgi:hypothetical protein